MRAQAGVGQVKWYTLSRPLLEGASPHRHHLLLERRLQEWCQAHGREPDDMGRLAPSARQTLNWWDQIVLQGDDARLVEAQDLVGQAINFTKTGMSNRAITCANKACKTARELSHLPQAAEICALAEETKHRAQQDIPLEERSDEFIEADRAAKAASHQREHGVLDPGHVRAGAAGTTLINKHSTAGDYWR